MFPTLSQEESGNMQVMLMKCGVEKVMVSNILRHTENVVHIFVCTLLKLTNSVAYI